jgi:hypothetical protein
MLPEACNAAFLGLVPRIHGASLTLSELKLAASVVAHLPDSERADAMGPGHKAQEGGV